MCVAGNVRQFVEALVSETRHPSIREDEDIYAPLLGSWNVTVREMLEDGREVRGEGECLFVRVLEGRAVQDVWITPPRAERATSSGYPKNRYGTAIRMFNPDSRLWQVIWLNPVSGAFDVLHSRVENGKIIQVGSGTTGGFICWTFERVARKEFHLVGRIRGENDEWRIGTEFCGQRCT